MITISEKQKELIKLQEQLVVLQREVSELESKNPTYKKRCDELLSKRSKIKKTLTETRTLEINSFVKIEYKWSGIGQYPEIVSCEFLLAPQINEILHTSIIDYGNSELIFDSDFPEVIAACSRLTELDDKIKSFNEEVSKAFNEFKESYLSTLLFT